MSGTLTMSLMHAVLSSLVLGKLNFQVFDFSRKQIRVESPTIYKSILVLFLTVKVLFILSSLYLQKVINFLRGSSLNYCLGNMDSRLI